MKNAIFALLLCACASFAQLTAVRAGRLIDPDSGTVLTDQVILIQGSKIQAVGKALAIPAGPRTAVRITATAIGRTRLERISTSMCAPPESRQ